MTPQHQLSRDPHLIIEFCLILFKALEGKRRAFSSGTGRKAISMEHIFGKHCIFATTGQPAGEKLELAGRRPLFHRLIWAV